MDCNVKFYFPRFKRKVSPNTSYNGYINRKKKIIRLNIVSSL